MANFHWCSRILSFSFCSGISQSYFRGGLALYLAILDAPSADTPLPPPSPLSKTRASFLQWRGHMPPPPCRIIRTGGDVRSLPWGTCPSSRRDPFTICSIPLRSRCPDEGGRRLSATTWPRKSAKNHRSLPITDSFGHQRELEHWSGQ